MKEEEVEGEVMDVSIVVRKVISQESVLKVKNI